MVDNIGNPTGHPAYVLPVPYVLHGPYVIPVPRDGKSVYNSTDEYLVQKNSTKTHIFRHIAICAKTA